MPKFAENQEAVFRMHPAFWPAVFFQLNAARDDAGGRIKQRITMHNL